MFGLCQLELMAYPNFIVCAACLRVLRASKLHHLAQCIVCEDAIRTDEIVRCVLCG